jgi:hypothetical protein
MKSIYLKGTFDTPNVIFDKETGVFEISGRSLPENAYSFYKPLLDWLDEYKKAPNEETVLHIKLEYFNTASSKALLDIFTKLEGLKAAKIAWHYMFDDEDMEEAGTEYAELVDVPFEFIEMKGVASGSK